MKFSVRMIAVLALAVGLVSCQNTPAIAECPAEQQGDDQDVASDIPASLVKMRGEKWADVAETVTRFYPELRVLEPGAMMTMDHVPERLNMYLDCNGRITGMRFG